MIKTVLFDLDDTLYNERDFVFGAFKAVCSHLSKKHTISEYELYEEILEIFNEHGRGRIFNILCKNYNIDENIQELIDIYRNAKPEIKLYDDSIYMLKKLKDNYNTGIITDGKASVQWNKIELLGVSRFIDKIIVTDDYGTHCWKPSEFAYNEMIKHFNCLPSETIYVGDNPHKDFIGARNVGVNTVRIIRQQGDHVGITLGSEYEADFNIRSLLELEEIIKNLNKVYRINFDQ